MKLVALEQHRMVNLARLTMQEWFADNTPRHAAALAYYTIFALAPLLTIVFSLAGAFYGYDVARSNIVALVQQYSNNAGVAELIGTVLANSVDTSSNPLLTVLSVGVLIYGATSVFSELQSALNTIWDAPPKTDLKLRDIFRNRLFAIVMVFLGGLVLLASLIITTVIATANQWADTHLHVTIYSEWVIFFSLFGISTLIFALIYKFVPDVQIAWHDVLIGAITTGLLFAVARALINWSLSYTSITSIFGATGSLVVLLVWIYYSALIFFLGAEFTQVYGRTYGSRWREQQLLAAENAKEVIETVETAEGVIVPDDNALADMTTLDPAFAEPAISALPSETILDEVAPALESVDPNASKKPTARQRIDALGGQLRRGVTKVQQNSQRLRKLPGAITAPLGDIAMGVVVVGAISVTGFLLEPWRRKQKAREPKVGDE